MMIDLNFLIFYLGPRDMVDFNFLIFHQGPRDWENQKIQVNKSYHISYSTVILGKGCESLEQLVDKSVTKLNHFHATS